MTERLYYTDSFLHEFDAQVLEAFEIGGEAAVVLDRTAFYPASGGQLCDTGILQVSPGDGAPIELRVKRVEENSQGDVVHLLDAPAGCQLDPGTDVHGRVDAERRRDHMQQHSGQHVLSAAFIKLLDVPTLSFHMGDEICTVDLAAQGVSAEELAKVQELGNRIVWENRAVTVRFVDLEQARVMGVRKLPNLDKIAVKTRKDAPAGNSSSDQEAEGALVGGGHQLRLIEISGFDLNACGGTHVGNTGQIGPILMRKSEKVARGVRIEFVCGDRALATALQDFRVLTEAATVLSTHLWEVPQQVRKLGEEVRAARKAQLRLSAELAELWADRLCGEAVETDGYKLVRQVYADRDVWFVKTLAQKLTRHSRVLALLGTTAEQPTVVFARSQDLDLDASRLMKEVLAKTNGRGGGSRDLAQGGLTSSDQVTAAIDAAAGLVRTLLSTA
ncbi:MAG TPA: DHHA1 domain-containing protein [Terriglobales bacterium]|nr:DHHA1 domain-containing protein [Terriglobales bacterium]